MADTYATAESTRQREGESHIEHANRTYCPTNIGIHLCGADHEDNRFFTILNWPLATEVEARAAFERLREFAVDGDDGDFTVDLNTRDGHEDDFYSSRQLLPRIHAALRELTPERAA